MSAELSTQGILIATGVIVVLAVVLYWAARVAGHRYVERMTAKSPDRGARAETLWTVMRRVILLVIVVTALMFVLSVWGVGIAPFLGVGAVLAAAVGFGAQNLVRDFIAGFFILMEDQFHVGDTVTIAGTTGTVEDVQLRVTVLRDLEGNVHYVPNGAITVTSNFTSKYAQPVIDVGVPHDADLDRAIELLRDELTRLADAETYGALVTEPPEILGVTEMTSSEVILRARLTTRANARWTVRREALRRIKYRFEAEGIPVVSARVSVDQTL